MWPVRVLRIGLPALATALLVLTACQQPTPGVTIQSGTRVVRDDATVYLRNGHEVRGSGAVKVLTVRPGALVGIDVDGTIADHGWTVHITARTAKASDRTTLDSPLLKGQHHFTFDAGSETTDVVIAEQGGQGQAQGLWAFTLRPTSQ